MGSSGRASVRKSRWLRLGAEQAIMPDVPSCRHLSIKPATFSSHGHLSRSSGGWPDCSLARAAAEWSSSPSSNGQLRRWARVVAIVVLPLPERPTTMRIGRTPPLSAPSAFTAIWHGPGRAVPGAGVGRSAGFVVPVGLLSTIADQSSLLPDADEEPSTHDVVQH